MSLTLERIKIKMDGQEHELSDVEHDSKYRALFLDVENTICIKNSKEELFNKKVEICTSRSSNDFTKARIDSYYNDGETENNHILGLSY